ncbi:MAG: hypothetical protein QM804_19215 [Propionicimonas sp.]
MLDLVAAVLPFETTDGPHDAGQVASATGELSYTTTTEAYRRVAAVARGAGSGGGQRRLRLRRRPAGPAGNAAPGWRVRELVSGDLEAVLRLPSAEREVAPPPAVMAARELLTGDDCDVLVRVFRPDLVPAILLRDAEGEHRRELDREREADPNLWDGLLDALADQPARRAPGRWCSTTPPTWCGKLLAATGTRESSTPACARSTCRR